MRAGIAVLVTTLAVVVSCQYPGKAGPGGLRIEDQQVGAGALAEAGKTIQVHYVGYLAGGAKFDSTHDRGAPVEFVLGRGLVIPGWDRGLAGMRVGGKRKLTIPPELAYGVRGAGESVGPHATLIFDVELVGVR